jgi:hypothetical protein
MEIDHDCENIDHFKNQTCEILKIDRTSLKHPHFPAREGNEVFGEHRNSNAETKITKVKRVWLGFVDVVSCQMKRIWHSKEFWRFLKNSIKIPFKWLLSLRLNRNFR